METIKGFALNDTLFRHGDVMLKKTGSPVRGDIPVMKTGLLHKGEQHHHSLEGNFYIRFDGEKKYLGILGQTTLIHEEHGPIPLSPDVLENTELLVDIQMEYDHFLEESRQVID